MIFETLCFHAQQAAEKAIKAVLVAEGADLPRTHDLGVLFAAVPLSVPIGLDRASVLGVVAWARDVLSTLPPV